MAPYNPPQNVTVTIAIIANLSVLCSKGVGALPHPFHSWSIGSLIDSTLHFPPHPVFVLSFCLASFATFTPHTPQDKYFALCFGIIL